ncbi:MAG TPA: adenylate/guanylate cyclase domain-containing protein, partial [bacterium]|nr:adenylate/guanylate cyclase domain-containing protein [bacterium]
DSIALNPGKYLEFSTGDSVISISPTQTKKIKYPIRIPIDNSGMMYINWSGAYKDTFKNIPYNLIAMHYLYIIAKKYLSNFAVGAVDANQVFNGLNQELLKAGITSSDNAEVIAVKMFSAWLMEFFYNNNMTYQDFLAQMGADDDIELKKIWTQIVFNNKLFDKLKDTNSPQYDEILKEMNIDINDTNYRDVILEGWKQTVFFYSRGMINQMRPLFFPAPSNLKIGLRTEQISLLELTNKIIFTGLTATGLAAFNPMPFEDRYMMLGMPANVMNTIITNQYLKPANFILMALIFIILIFFITFFTMRSTTVGSIAAVLLFIIYPLIAWYLFNVGYILPIVPFSLGILLSLLSAIAYKFIEVQRERKKIKNMFSTMVAPEVLKIIEENPDKFNLSGELREATMFSSDVSGFTTISEGVTAQELANILNIYLTPMSNIVMKYNGYIDKYEGDAIKADFGVLPLQSSSEWKLDSEHSWKCCYSALEQQEELSVIQRMIQIKYGVKISARMGVNTGVVSAGNMGSEKKRQFSVMGAAVTLAEELEPINKIFETWIAIGPSTYEKSKTYIETRFLNYLITHEDQPLLPVNELLGWKTEKFLEYWLGKPVPQLILEGIRNMAPEKILGYHHYYTHKKLPDTEFIMQIKKRFADLVAPSIAFIQNNDILSVNDLVEELANLNIKFKQYYNDGDFDKAAARKDYIAFKEKLSSVKKNWEKHIIEWKMQITLFLNLLLYVDTKLETKISEDLYKIVDTLEKRIECFNKRCQFTPANDEIACEIGNHLQNLIENNKMQINKIEIENKINKIKSEISANLNAMADFIIANSDDYHRMISAYCEVSEKKRKVIEMFKNAREFYLKKQFEKAIEVFKEILTIDPNDGPSAKYIAYIQKLKKDDLPEDWNGAWHAE